MISYKEAVKALKRPVKQNKPLYNQQTHKRTEVQIKSPSNVQHTYAQPPFDYIVNDKNKQRFNPKDSIKFVHYKDGFKNENAFKLKRSKNIASMSNTHRQGDYFSAQKSSTTKYWYNAPSSNNYISYYEDM